MFWLGICMGFLGDMARFFLGGQEEPPYEPTEEDLEDGATLDEFTREGGEGEDYYEEGVDMGTVPDTPIDDGSDTDPQQDVGFLRRLLGF